MSALHIDPAATDDEAVAIMAAVEGLWPRPVADAAAPRRPSRAWQFSGRWWMRDRAAVADRPWG